MYFQENLFGSTSRPLSLTYKVANPKVFIYSLELEI